MGDEEVASGVKEMF